MHECTPSGAIDKADGGVVSAMEMSNYHESVMSETRTQADDNVPLSGQLDRSLLRQSESSSFVVHSFARCCSFVHAMTAVTPSRISVSFQDGFSRYQNESLFQVGHILSLSILLV